MDTYATHLREVLRAAGTHHGTAFVQIYQNCNIFNDGAFDAVREKDLRDENVIHLEHGKPLIFGKNRDRGIRLGSACRPEVVTLGGDSSEKELLIHDETAPSAYAFMLAQMEPPDFPTPIGVLRRVQAPTFDASVREQVRKVTEKKGAGDLAALMASGETWVVS